jgi:two-component system phosphate regulon sensor histidine kinase PhoR
MKYKIFWKFFFAFLVVISFFLIVSYLFLRSYLGGEITREISHRLDQVLTQVQDSVEASNLSRFTPETVDPLIDRLSKGLEARVTLIDGEGTVLGDSELSGKELAEMENHGKRPEVIQARENGFGQSIRYSTTLKMPMMYVARPFSQGVLRVALPLSGTARSYDKLKHLLGAGLLIGAGIALLISLYLSRHFSQSLRELAHAATRMAEGDLKIQVPVRRNDEIGLLSRRFNYLSEKLVVLIQKISEEKKQLQVILESMVEGVMVLNSEGKILLTNQALREIFEIELTPEGHTPLEVVRNAELQGLVEQVLSGQDSLEREIPITRGGNLKQVMIHASPLKIQGETKGSVLVFYDVTHQRHLENVRKEFVANVSHELKTPLSAIKGYAETLLSGALEDKENAKNFLSIIDRHADRLHQIVQDLLDLSRIESAQYELRLEKIPLASLVEELNGTFQKELDQKKIAWKASLGVESVWADPTALRQILSNLCDNAIKYSSSEGGLEIKIEPSGSGVLACVQDSGPGISPEHLPRIFERFYRVDSSRSRQLGGTGLGLSIVKHLVQLHGGEVWAESEIGKGSCFYFTIPQRGMI